VDGLQKLDAEDVAMHVEEEVERFEKAFCQLFSSEV
jgi:hypothetical protein